MSDCTDHTIPETAKEYERAYLENHEISGYGPEVSNDFPCPFCAAPHWYKIGLLEFGPPIELRGAWESEEISCECCGRSAKYVGMRDGNGVTMHLEQTSGDPLPEWLLGVIQTQVGVQRQ